MAKYTINVYGWELNGSAQSITDQQVQELIDYQIEMGIEDLSEIGYSLEDVIENYEPFMADLWVISKVMDHPDSTYIEVVNEVGDIVIECKLSDLTTIDEVDELYEPPMCLAGFPEEGVNDNVLLFLEENKGLVCSYDFICNGLPKVEDINYSQNLIETTDGDWEFVDNFYHKQLELEQNFDNQSVRGKALTVEVVTLDDVDF